MRIGASGNKKAAELAAALRAHTDTWIGRLSKGKEKVKQNLGCEANFAAKGSGLAIPQRLRTISLVGWKPIAA